MKTEKEEIDRLIEQALTEEEAAFYHKLDEQNIFGMIGGLFQGKMKWLNILTLIIQLIMLAAAVYCGIGFFNAADPVQAIQFGAGVFFFMIAIGTLKMFHIMEMNKNATIREIKRMELQVSVLAGRLKERE